MFCQLFDINILSQNGLEKLTRNSQKAYHPIFRYKYSLWHMQTWVCWILWVQFRRQGNRTSHPPQGPGFRRIAPKQCRLSILA